MIPAWISRLLLSVLALAGGLSTWIALVSRRLRLDLAVDEVHYPLAADGWRLALWRLRPANGRPHPVPVVLCHGLGANRYNSHFGKDLSLGRFLAERGHDVFIMELRGSGRSSRPGPRGPHGKAAREFGFDEHLRLDVPAHLTRVLEVSGARQVFWVGHSMGGMLAYALAAGPWAERLAGFVAVGSPGYWDGLGRRLLRFVRWTGPLARRGTHLRSLLTVLAPLFGWVHPPGSSLAVNPRNIDGAVVRRALYNLVGDLSPGHVAQFSRWLRTDRFDSRDGAVDYRAGLSRVEVPAYVLAGSVDQLAPPQAVRRTFEALGSEDKTFALLGKDCGCEAEYGHGDLLLGRRAPEEVFPRIAGWIEARMPAAAGQGADRAAGR